MGSSNGISIVDYRTEVCRKLITLRPNMGSRGSTKRVLVFFFFSLVTLGSGMCKALQGACGNQNQ